MGFYIRKSKSVGPVRFNLSKSGIGVSTGIKGARISTGPNGTYINLGRNGLYYRKKLGGKVKNQKYNSTPNSPAISYENSYEYTDVIRVAPNSAEQSDLDISIVKDIKRARLFRWIWWIALFVVFYTETWWVLPILLLFRIIFRKLFNAVIKYDLDSNSELEWEKYSEIINLLKSSKKIWIIETAKRTYNTKYNAGASRNISRGAATVRKIHPNRATGVKVKTNVASISIKGNKCTILFLPSGIVIKKGTSYVSYPYERVLVSSTYTRFVENSPIPRDAEVVDYTWQYVNKNGTADRRFSKNKKIPVCKYGCLEFMVGQEVSIELQLSNNALTGNVGNAYSHYRSYISSIGSSSVFSGSTQNQIDDHIQGVVDELNTSVKETGRELSSDFSEWLSCKVRFVDGQYYDNRALFFYRASKDVVDLLPGLEAALKGEFQYDVELRPVSTSSFLSYINLNEDIDLSQYSNTLSPILTDAILKADNWEFEHSSENRLSDNTAQNNSYESIAASGVSLFDDDLFGSSSSDEDYGTLFEEDSNSESNAGNNELIDDMLTFLDEE